MQLVLHAVDLNVVRFAVDDGVVGGVINVHGLAVAVRAPADVVKLIFVDACGLVQLEDGVLVAVRVIVLVAADVEVDVLLDHIAEGQRQRPRIGGVAGIVLRAELVDVGTRDALDEALVHAAEQRLLKVLLLAPRRAAVGGQGVEVVCVGQIALGNAEDLAVHQIVELIALAGLHGGRRVGHALEQVGSSGILLTADSALAVHIVVINNGLPCKKRIAAAAGVGLERVAQLRGDVLHLLGGLCGGLVRADACNALHAAFQIEQAAAVSSGLILRADAEDRAKAVIAGSTADLRNLAGIVAVGNIRTVVCPSGAADRNAARKAERDGDIAGIVAVGNLDRAGRLTAAGDAARIAMSRDVHCAEAVFDLCGAAPQIAGDTACTLARRGNGAGHAQILDHGFTGHEAEQSLLVAGVVVGIVDINVQVLNDMAVAIKCAGELPGAIVRRKQVNPRVVADGRPRLVLKIDVRCQLRIEVILAAVDLVCKPAQLVGRADLINAVFILRRLCGSSDRNGTLRLCLAAGRGDGGSTDLQCGDDAVFDGGNVLSRGRPSHGLVRDIVRLDRRRQGRGLARVQGQLGLVKRYAGSGNALRFLLKAHRNVVIRKICGLRETGTVVAGAGDVELHLRDLAEAGQVELRPVRDDVRRAVAKEDAGLAGLGTGSVVAGSRQLDPVRVVDLRGQVVAVEIAVDRVADVVDIHMVDHTLFVVNKREGGENLAVRVAGIVLVAEVHGEVVGAVVAAAGALETGRVLLVDGQLIAEVAVGGKLTGDIVGNGMAAAPVAVVSPTGRKRVGQAGVVRVRPGVGLADVRRAGAVRIEHRAAVLRVVDQARPVGLSGKIRSALVVGILEGQNAQLIIRRRFLSENGGRQQREDHQNSQH